jgi:histidine triad (HIT) family protein
MPVSCFLLVSVMISYTERNGSTMSCIFCRIVDRSAPAEIVYEDEELLVFQDINPRAPIHVLLVPREHIATVNDLEVRHTPLMGKFFITAKILAARWNLVESGYRLSVHVGRGGGQIIDHVHMHLLGGWERSNSYSAH